MLAFGSAVEPYRAANICSGVEHYRWSFLSEDGKPVTASNGMQVVPDRAPVDDDQFDRLFVCGGINTRHYKHQSIMQWLGKLAQNNTPLGGISTGTWTLAHAGLLEHSSCTIHWQSLDAFREAYPDIATTPSVYVIDGERLTCCGGTGALDLMVHLIATDCGDDVVTDVCTWLFHDRIRVDTDVQGVALHASLAQKSVKLATAFRVMSAHIEKRLTPKQIAAKTGISQRQLERLFQAHLQCTPQQKYMNLRLQHARRLLLETSLTILDISTATGFTNQSHFTKCYREQYNQTPRSMRLGLSEPVEPE